MNALKLAMIKTETFRFSVFELKREFCDLGEFIFLENHKVRWLASERTQFIEWILLGAPVSTFYFCVRGTKTCLLDGHERLRALFDFMDNTFSMESLAYYPEYNGKYFSDLAREDQKSIESRQLSCVVFPELAEAELAYISKGLRFHA